jgi:hypothetical protein
VVDKPEIGDIKADIPRNRQRPEESDEMRGQMPKQGRRRKGTEMPGRTNGTNPEVARLARKLKGFNEGPSSYRKRLSAKQERVEKAIKRRASRDPSVYDLVHDRNFYAILHMQAYEGQIQADWNEIVNGGAPESRKLLDEMLEQYEAITGITPRGYF